MSISYKKVKIPEKGFSAFFSNSCAQFCSPNDTITSFKNLEKAINGIRDIKCQQEQQHIHWPKDDNNCFRAYHDSGVVKK